MQGTIIDWGYSEYKHCLVWRGPAPEEKRLTVSEAYEILTHSKAWMLENVYDWDCDSETNFWELICDKIYPIESLPSKTRNQVRRSLRDCEIRIITNYELIEADGYEVYKRAFERYGNVTVNISKRERWETNIAQATNNEFWGVFKRDSGQLIAYAMNSIHGRGVNYNTLKAIPEFMNKHYPYYGLLFEMNRYYLSENGYQYVSDGFRSITEHSNIQPFLEKNFLFRKSYCRISIYYKRWLGILISISYPFRRFIPIRSVRHLLNLETIRRGKITL